MKDELDVSGIGYSIKVKLQSGEMTVSGEHWPIFLYAGFTYDPEDPWNGLLRSSLLVSIRQLSCSTLVVVNS